MHLQNIELSEQGSSKIKNPLESKLGYQIRRASVINMHRLNNALLPYSVNTSEASVLLLIRSNPGIKQSEIGKELSIQRANMTPIINNLSKRDIILKEKLDGRSYGLYLSESGALLVDEIHQCIEDEENSLASLLTKSEQQLIIRIFKRIRQKRDST